jgi:hypothetical protein
MGQRMRPVGKPRQWYTLSADSTGLPRPAAPPLAPPGSWGVLPCSTPGSQVRRKQQGCHNSTLHDESACTGPHGGPMRSVGRLSTEPRTDSASRVVVHGPRQASGVPAGAAPGKCVAWNRLRPSRPHVSVLRARFRARKPGPSLPRSGPDQMRGPAVGHDGPGLRPEALRGGPTGAARRQDARTSPARPAR